MLNFKHILNLIALSFALSMCVKKNTETSIPLKDQILEKNDFPMKALDLSYVPEIRQYGIPTKNNSAQLEDMLLTVKNSKYNTIRLRLWKNPSNVHSGFEEVKAFANEIKSQGMKVWLTVHYSDTWADPGNQTKPQQWTGISFQALKDSVYLYTKKIMQEINPDYIQIGNEINSGLLWPEGNFSNKNQMLDLMDTASKAIRNTNPLTQIMIHYAGITNAELFFENFKTISYDLICLSYYPFWHGKDLGIIHPKMEQLKTLFQKNIVIAETAYPFTFGWNDYTNNIIGDNSQILSDYNATPSGQLAYLTALKSIIDKNEAGYGLCYWGAEWVAFKGNTATNGSSWENQALWDFNYKALPALDIYK
jgi:arabinogalactan endo-1,4-beta-galactosidase